MDPLDFLDDQQLLDFFHRNKTEISCLEKPNTFLNQLRDHNLIPENRYKKIIRRKSKDNMKNDIYEVLDWLERERPKHIKLFWSCVFKENILIQYPTLRILRNSLMDGSFQFNVVLPERVDKEEHNERKRKTAEDGEEEKKKGMTGKRTKKQRTESLSGEEEEPHPSSQLTPRQSKRRQKPTFSTPLKKGEKNDIWNWAIYKVQLPVTCGDQKGMLNRVKMAKGERCIMAKNQWFTPSGFEEFAGKKRCRNWRQSIRCTDTTLAKLIQEGHLKYAHFKRKRKEKHKDIKAKKSLFDSDGLDTDIEEEDEDQDSDQEEESTTPENESSDTRFKKIWLPVFIVDVEEEESTQESDDNPSSGAKTVYKVTCGSIAGTLHTHRFASGTCGKSIRTERSWMTPMEFVNAGSPQPDASWKRDIQWEGKPLNDLIVNKALNIHSILCKCRKCTPDPEFLEDQKNDDNCYICTRCEGKLVVCEQCPRSFHQKCHLPWVHDDDLLWVDVPWVCTFCVLFASQEWRYPSQLTYETALCCEISEHLLECQYLLLCLYNSDAEQIFVSDPSIHVTAYTSVINTPMWLEKVAEKLQQNLYQTVGQFVSDIMLIFTNCATFNRDNAEFRTMGVKLRGVFETEFKKAFRIQQETP